MKKLIIILCLVLAVAGIAAGGLLLYKNECEKKYDYEDEEFVFCEGLKINFDEDSFPVPFLRPSFESSDEDIFIINKEGIMETVSPGTAEITVSNFIFEVTAKVTVTEHEGEVEDCDLPYKCKKCKEKVYVKGGHTYTELTCLDDSYCTICGTVKELHKGHDFMDATCENPQICKVCSAKEGEALGHQWVEAECDSPAYCSVCNKKGDAPIGHQFSEASCEEGSKCVRCGKQGALGPLGHKMQGATCTEPAKCERCDYTEGKELGHSAGTVKCLETSYCTRCNAVIKEAEPHDFAKATCTTPKKCKKCGVTEGTAAGHQVVEATCTKGSYCSVCKTSFSTPLEHVYVQNENGNTICAYCGKSKSTYYYSGGTTDTSGYAESVLALVNETRAQVGLGPLVMDGLLTQAANVRAVEIVSLFEHTRPDGRRCFTAMDEAGCSYGYAGENIAYGYTTPQSVMTAWNNSSGHYANIIGSHYKRLGVGIYTYNGVIYWVQMFSD